MASKPLFINTTVPYLDRENSKSVRAYTTRANFAKRRQQRAKLHAKHQTAAPPKQNAGTQPLYNGAHTRLAVTSLVAHKAHPLTASLSNKGAFLLDYLFKISYPITFISVNDGAVLPIPNTADGLTENGWLELVFSEPAMMEATICLAATHYHQSKGGSDCLAAAYTHNSQAIQIINEQLDDPLNRLSDGLMSAVFTLAFCAHSREDEDTWNTHMLGLAQMASFRMTKTHKPPPPWLSDLISSSLVNHLVLTARQTGKPDDEIAATLCGSRFPSFGPVPQEAVFGLARHVFSLQFGNVPESQSLKVTHICDTIDQLLRRQSPGSETYMRPSVRAFSLAMKIFLRLFHAESAVPYEFRMGTSSELRAILQGPNIRLCATLELTFWELMLGCLCAPDPATQNWFIFMLQRACQVLQITAWEDVLRIFKSLFWTDTFLRACYTTWSGVIQPRLIQFQY